MVFARGGKNLKLRSRRMRRDAGERTGADFRLEVMGTEPMRGHWLGQRTGPRRLCRQLRPPRKSCFFGGRNKSAADAPDFQGLFRVPAAFGCTPNVLMRV